MLVDHTAALRTVMDLRNLLDRLHKQKLRLKAKREGIALSQVTRILRESRAFRGECSHPKAIIDGYDPNTDAAVELNENMHTVAYLQNFERTNRRVMGKTDRIAFSEVRWLLDVTSVFGSW